MAQRVALRFAAIVGDCFVASGETYWLEGQEADLFWIVQRELDDASHLLVVDAVDDCYYRDDFHSGAVQVVDRFQLHVEQVPYCAMRVGGVADTIELQIGIPHSRFGGLLRKFETLCELDS